jgi:hypothetical protein
VIFRVLTPLISTQVEVSLRAETNIVDDRHNLACDSKLDVTIQTRISGPAIAYKLEAINWQRFFAMLAPLLPYPHVIAEYPYRLAGSQCEGVSCPP